MRPDEAWRVYIAPHIRTPGWLERSRPISRSVGLSRRELLGLILYSFYLDESGTSRLCWDNADDEPNDGYIAMPTGETIRCEHKLVTQFGEGAVVQAILDTHRKNAERGSAYGANRHLLIHANRESKGLARISKLRDEIGGNTCFDAVICMNLNGVETGYIFRFSVSEHYPTLQLKHLRIQNCTGRLLV
jgi:hypothetical protein